MAAKSKIRKLLFASFRVVMLLYLFWGCGEEGSAVNAQNPDAAAELYLDGKETDVMAIAGNATVNNDNCGGLNNCTGSACSRVVCNPISGERESLNCTTVDRNELANICPAQSCVDKMLLDYTRSYVTLPAPAYTNLQPEVARDICLQRPLDPTFKSVSVQSNYSLVYFGSVSGAFRSFPGREQNETECKSYDPRRRPWYVNGISVSKDVKILVDVASSMGNPVPVQYQPDPKTTYLNVTQNITRGLLQTFSQGDYVEVISFDSQSATSLGGPVFMDASFDYLTAYRPEVLPLIEKVNSLVATQGVGASNLTGAIVKAVSSFRNASLSKVIIVLSNGQFAPLDTAFPTQTLKTSQTKLMIYKLPRDSYDTDPYLLNTTLETTLCSVSGSFELLDPPSTENPIYVMRSYFTFLAQTQLVAAGNKSTWSYKFTSVSQDISAITATYPAFGRDGLLIGMAGVDVIVDNLNPTLKGPVFANFKNRSQGNPPVPATIFMSCNYQKTAPSAICPNAPMPYDSAICQTDTSISLANRICCGQCSTGIGGGGNLSKGAEAGIGIGVVSIAMLVGLGGIWLCCKRRNGKRGHQEKINIDDFPGDRVVSQGIISWHGSE